MKLPLKSTIIGLFVFLLVLKTRTAFPADDVVVAGAVTVVTSGTGVVAAQSNSLHGQPAEQFSLISH